MLESSTIIAAIFFGVVTHYIYNLNYHMVWIPGEATYDIFPSVHMFFHFTGDVWPFIQDKILGILSKEGTK